MKIEAPGQKPVIPELARVSKGVKPVAAEQPQGQSIKVQLIDQVRVLKNKAMVADVGKLQAAQDAKVEAVKARVAEGTYTVSAREVAEKILSSASAEKS